MAKITKDDLRTVHYLAQEFGIDRHSDVRFVRAFFVSVGRLALKELRFQDCCSAILRVNPTRSALAGSATQRPVSEGGMSLAVCRPGLGPPAASLQALHRFALRDCGNVAQRL
jgi:hypothetical protein